MNEFVTTPYTYANQGVYFVQGETTKRIKIGYSSQIEKRIKGLQTSEPIKLIHVIPNASTDAESSLHNKFSHMRTHGEWFTSHPKLLAFIYSLKMQNLIYSLR